MTPLLRKPVPLPRDKALHAGLSAIAVTAVAPVVGIGLALVAVFGLGLAKEVVWDLWLGRGTFDWWDLAADVLGIALGVAVSLLTRKLNIVQVRRRKLVTDAEE